MVSFAGLTRDMFSLYVPDKWSSNVHNLPRMRAKDTLVALCDAADDELSAELRGLARAASDEIPNITNQKKVASQWVYWTRDAEAKAALATFLEKTPLTLATIFHIAPQDKHAVLAVIADARGIWVGLSLPAQASVDRRNLTAKLAHAWERERLVAQLSGLEGATLVLGERQWEAHRIADADLVQLQNALTTSQEALRLGFLLEVDDVLDPEAELVPRIRNYLGQTIAAYRFVAWTRENDLIDAAKQLQEEKKVQKRRGRATYKKGDVVRFVAGVFSGRQGVVEGIDNKAQIKVQLGKLSIVVPQADLIASPSQAR